MKWLFFTAWPSPGNRVQSCASENDTKSSYLNTDSLPWRESPYPGVRWKKLHHDPESGLSAVLLRFEPDTHYGFHRHPAGEQYLVLEGTLEDGGHSYGPGTYVYHPPGSTHRPFSREGCLVFVTLPQPIEDLEQETGQRRS